MRYCIPAGTKPSQAQCTTASANFSSPPFPTQCVRKAFSLRRRSVGCVLPPSDTGKGNRFEQESCTCIPCSSNTHSLQQSCLTQWPFNTHTKKLHKFSHACCCLRIESYLNSFETTLQEMCMHPFCTRHCISAGFSSIFLCSAGGRAKRKPFLTEFSDVFAPGGLDVEQVTALLQAYGHELYAAGRPYGHFSATINAVTSKWPKLKRVVQQVWGVLSRPAGNGGGASFGTLRMAVGRIAPSLHPLQVHAFAWLREEPPVHHTAMPWQVLLSILATALCWGWVLEAGVLALAWGGLLRVGESLQQNVKTFLYQEISDSQLIMRSLGLVNTRRASVLRDINVQK